MRLLILLIFLLVLVVFALSNPAPVHLGIWPTDLVLVAPMSLTILVGMGVAFFVGALFVWFSAMGQRRRARRAEARVRALDAEVAALRARLSDAAISLPPPA